MAARAPKQKMDGDGYDWVHTRSRRIHCYTQRAGVGKSIKNKLARARRRAAKKETKDDE